MTYPDFTNGEWTEDGIKEFADKYGLKVEFKYKSKVGYQEGEIISQSRASGTTVTAGVTITITVAKAIEEDDTTADITGLD